MQIEEKQKKIPQEFKQLAKDFRKSNKLVKQGSLSGPTKIVTHVEVKDVSISYSIIFVIDFCINLSPVFAPIF